MKMDIQYNLVKIACLINALHVYNTLGENTVNSVATNETYVNVTACFGKQSYDLGIYPDQNLTIFQAEKFCNDEGYSRLFGYPIRWRRWDHVVHALATNGFLGNYTFLDSRFRPTFYTDSWVVSFNCFLMKGGDVVIHDDPFHQCAAVTFPDVQLDQFTKRVDAVNCNVQMPFVCENTFGSLSIDLFEGFDVNETTFSTIHFHMNLLHNVTDVTNCTEACTNTSCVSFTFNASSEDCKLYSLTSNTGPVSYTIINTYNNITHGLKTGCSASIFNTSFNYYSTGVHSELPLCGLSPIPPGYCAKCDVMTQEELTKQVAEIVANLTVPKKSTAKTRQLYESAYEERPYAVATGTLAFIIIVVVLSLPVISDVLSKYIQIKSAKKKSKKRSQKKTETISQVET